MQILNFPEEILIPKITLILFGAKSGYFLLPINLGENFSFIIHVNGHCGKQ